MFFRPLKFLCAAALLLSAGAAQSYVGEWHSFVNQDNITALQAYRGFMFVGTTGGVRKIDPGNLSETSYTNLDGLLDVYVTGFAVAGDNLWAVSKNGFVHQWDGRRFVPYGRAYESERWRMN